MLLLQEPGLSAECGVGLGAGERAWLKCRGLTGPRTGCRVSPCVLLSVGRPARSPAEDPQGTRKRPWAWEVGLQSLRFTFQLRAPGVRGKRKEAAIRGRVVQGHRKRSGEV